MGCMGPKLRRPSLTPESRMLMLISMARVGGVALAMVLSIVALSQGLPLPWVALFVTQVCHDLDHVIFVT